MSFDAKICKEFIEKEFTNSALPSLVDFIKINNLSKGFYDTKEEWEGLGWPKLQEAAEHIQKWAVSQGIEGLKSEIISDFSKNLTPIVFIQIEGQVDETYFFYGHFDKQPPFFGWKEGYGPCIPVLVPAENPEKLYGRGGADDGYSLYGSILAIKALINQNIPIPRCVILIQGDEETTSGDVEKHVENLMGRIGIPKLVFCLDSGCIDYDRMWLTTSLRGFCQVTLRIDILNEGVHSGASSGIVPGTFRILRSLIERIQSQQTGYMDSNLQVEIPPNRYKELYDLAKEKGKDAVRNFDYIGQLKTVSHNPLQSLILNGWMPQLSVTGIDGIPIPAKAGNVTLPHLQAKLSIRIPPTKNCEEAKAYIIKRLTENVPYDAKITILQSAAGNGFNAPQYLPTLQNAINEAGLEYYNQKVLAVSEGVSIPFMSFLKQIWPKAQFIVTGVLGPASNAHGPNEFLHLPYCKKLICSMAHILAKTVGKE